VVPVVGTDAAALVKVRLIGVVEEASAFAHLASGGGRVRRRVSVCVHVGAAA